MISTNEMIGPDRTGTEHGILKRANKTTSLDRYLRSLEHLPVLDGFWEGLKIIEWLASSESDK